MAENTTTSNNPPAAEPVVVTIPEERNTNNDKKEDKKQIENPKNNNKLKIPLKAIKKTQHMLPIVALMTFLLSIPFLFEAIWLLYVQQYDCEGLLKSLPRLQIGIAFGLICVFFVSNAVVYSRARFLVPGLIVVKVPLVVMFIVGLTLRGKFNLETREIAGSPSWLKMKVHGYGDWDGIKACLYDTRMCKDLDSSRSYSLKSYDGFDAGKLSPIESGCCNPPSLCEMEYVNMTYWRKPDRGTNINIPYDGDCDLWQNDETMLCYDCRTCKLGFVKTLEHKWLKLGTFLVVMSFLLMISHLVLFVCTMWEHHYKASHKL